MLKTNSQQDNKIKKKWRQSQQEQKIEIAGKEQDAAVALSDKSVISIVEPDLTTDYCSMKCDENNWMIW